MCFVVGIALTLKLCFWLKYSAGHLLHLAAWVVGSCIGLCYHLSKGMYNTISDHQAVIVSLMKLSFSFGE